MSSGKWKEQPFLIFYLYFAAQFLTGNGRRILEGLSNGSCIDLTLVFNYMHWPTQNIGTVYFSLLKHTKCEIVGRGGQAKVVLSHLYVPLMLWKARRLFGSWHKLLQPVPSDHSLQESVWQPRTR